MSAAMDFGEYIADQRYSDAVFDVSTRRTNLFIMDPPAPSTWTDRHCDECGMQEPHHLKTCTWREEK